MNKTVNDTRHIFRGCADYCKPFSVKNGSSNIETTCCDEYDFCNLSPSLVQQMFRSLILVSILMPVLLQHICTVHL